MGASNFTLHILSIQRSLHHRSAGNVRLSLTTELSIAAVALFNLLHTIEGNRVVIIVLVAVTFVVVLVLN